MTANEKPTAWAIKVATDLTPVEPGFTGAGGPGWHATRDAIAEAINAAHKQGWRAGMEEAAATCADRATAREAAAEEMHAAREYKDAALYRSYAAAERSLAGTLRTALAAKVTP